MKTLHALTMRNIRMYFKDRGMFLTSLITPPHPACAVQHISEKHL